MINKELIELQKGCKATCVVIQNKDCEQLASKVIVNSEINDTQLLTTIKEQVFNVEYLIIDKIDDLNADEQNKYYQIIKDREFNGYKLPKDIIIVLTVNDRESLKNISDELYHFCVVAF